MVVPFPSRQQVHPVDVDSADFMSEKKEPFGVLNLNKPAGITSRDLVNKVQRLVRPAKVGHAGTLDPLATGVLLVCVGAATRLVSMLQEGVKTYVAEFTLGQTSDTDDSSGKIDETPRVGDPPTREQIVQCLQSMTGVISQVPPDFSAVHVNGQRAYTLARQGEEMTLNAKQIEIHSIQVVNYEWPHVELEIHCGSGTYIRSIARDLGKQLNCGGLMSRLERTRVAGFDLADALMIDDLTLENLEQCLCPAIRIVDHLAKFDCLADDVTNLLCGRLIKLESARTRPDQTFTPGQVVALTRGGFAELLALSEVTPAGMLQPRVVFLKSSS